MYPNGTPQDYIAKFGSLNAAAAAAGFDAVAAGVPTDLLSRAVGLLSVSAEVYLSMRARFARSLATLTVCGHVLGIGDRHLDNVMMLDDGHFLHIDFGYILGDDPKKKLIAPPPFRFTKSMVDALGGVTGKVGW